MHADSLTKPNGPGTAGRCNDGPRNRPPHEAVSEHRAYLALASAAIAAGLLLSLAGCQTPAQPTYGNGMVPPPATGAVGQPAPYGPVGAPQVSYAQTPMPGPANSWQAAPAGTPPPPGTVGYAAPQAGAPPPQIPPGQAPPVQAPPAQPAPPGSQPPPTTPAGSTWGWSQGQPPPAQQPPPTYGNPAAPVQQGVNAQAQQLNNQAQTQVNQWAGQANQQINGAQQQFNNQAQAATNQFQNGVNAQAQQFNGQMPQQQTTNGSWWPFSDPNAVPPARSTPAAVPKY